MVACAGGVQVNSSGERRGRTFLWSMKRIVRSPYRLGVGRYSVGELKVHWYGGGSVRYPPALLLDVEHCEVRDAFVSRATVHSPTSLHHASLDMTAAGLRLWRSLKPRSVSSRGFHSGGDSCWQGSSGNLIPMVIEQTVSCCTACVVSGL